MIKKIECDHYRKYYTSIPRRGNERPESGNLKTSFSDSLYNEFRGTTHYLHHYDPTCDSKTRFVSDVEICMSSDPNLASHFTSEHRSILRQQLQSQARSPHNGQPTDEQLLQNGAMISLERDELVKAVKNNINLLDNDLMLAQSMQSLTSEPKPEPKPEPSNT